MTKKFLAALVGAATLAAMAMTASAADYNWVAAIHLGENTTHTQALQYFADQLKEKSGGAIEVTVSPVEPSDHSVRSLSRSIRV